MQDEREFDISEPDAEDRLRFQLERYVIGKEIRGYKADRNGMSLVLADGIYLRFEVREASEERKAGVDVILYLPVPENDTKGAVN